MSWMADVLSIFGGSGLSGIASAVISSIAKHKSDALSYEHEKSRWDYEVKMQGLQTNADQKLAEQGQLISKQQGEVDINLAELDTLMEAIKAESKIKTDGLPWWVRAVRVLLRPGLTIYLWVVLTIALIVAAWNGSHTTLLILEAIITCAMIAFGFWFGNRFSGNNLQR